MNAGTNGVIISRPHGGFRLAKQTPWGDEYVVFSYSAAEAWTRLSAITGRSVAELKRMAVSNL